MKIIKNGQSSKTQEELALRVDTVSDTLTYIGDAVIGTADSAAAWRVKRLNEVGTVLSIEWADGDQKFDNVWDDRTSLSYS